MIQALCSYALAIEHLVTDFPAIEFDNVYQIEALLATELYLILKKNFEFNEEVYENVASLMSDKEVYFC